MTKYNPAVTEESLLAMSGEEIRVQLALGAISREDIMHVVWRRFFGRYDDKLVEHLLACDLWAIVDCTEFHKDVLQGSYCQWCGSKKR